MSVTKGQLDYIDTLYDSFESKDMTRRAFRNAYIRLMDPRGVRRDIVGMIDQMHNGKQLRRTLSRN